MHVVIIGIVLLLLPCNAGVLRNVGAAPSPSQGDHIRPIRRYSDAVVVKTLVSETGWNGDGLPEYAPVSGGENRINLLEIKGYEVLRVDREARNEASIRVCAV